MPALTNYSNNTSTITSFENISDITKLICCVANVVLSLTAFGGNFLALGAIWKTPSLHSPTNVLFFGLALSDFGVGFIVQPLYVGGLVMSLRKHPIDFIMFYYWLQAFFVCTTVLTLTAVACDRFLAIFLHLRYQAAVTLKRTKFALCAIWITSTLYASTIIWAHYIYQKLTVTLISIFIITNTSFYFMIQRVVQRHQVQIQKQAHINMQCQGNRALNVTRYKKSVTNLLVLYILLILCYAPYLCTRVAIISSIRAAGHEIALNVVITLVYVNSSMNPVFYFWRMSELRTAMKQFLKTFSCQKLPIFDQITCK